MARRVQRLGSVAHQVVHDELATVIVGGEAAHQLRRGLPLRVAAELAQHALKFDDLGLAQRFATAAVPKMKQQVEGAER